MNPAEHRALRSDLGAYALGQLPIEEAQQVEEHLAGCDSCQAEYEELLPVVGLLADFRTPSEDTDPPPRLEDRVVSSIRTAERSRRRRTWVRSTSLLAAGAAAASVVLGATVGLGGDEPPPAAAPLEGVEVSPRVQGIEATADLVAHTWGVEVKLTATGFGRGDRYRVVVLGDDGRDYPAGGFLGTGAVEMICNLNSTVLRDSASGFEVRDTRGRVVATSRFEA